MLSQRLGIVIAQLGVGSKTNEIPIMEKLLESLVILGRVVTVDELLTQRAIAQAILAGGGNYLMTVKHNQPTLRDDIQTLFQSQLTPLWICGVPKRPICTEIGLNSDGCVCQRMWLDTATGRAWHK